MKSFIAAIVAVALMEAGGQFTLHLVKHSRYSSRTLAIALGVGIVGLLVLVWS